MEPCGLPPSTDVNKVVRRHQAHPFREKSQKFSCTECRLASYRQTFHSVTHLEHRKLPSAESALLSTPTHQGLRGEGFLVLLGAAGDWISKLLHPEHFALLHNPHLFPLTERSHGPSPLSLRTHTRLLSSIYVSSRETWQLPPCCVCVISCHRRAFVNAAIWLWQIMGIFPIYLPRRENSAHMVLAFLPAPSRIAGLCTAGCTCACMSRPPPISCKSHPILSLGKRTNFLVLCIFTSRLKHWIFCLLLTCIWSWVTST